MKVVLISQLPPPSGGIATWSKAYLEYMNKNKDVDIICVNSALRGERANNFNAKRNILTEIKRTISIVIDTYKKVHNNNINVVHFNSTASALGTIRDWFCIQMIRKDVPIMLHYHCTIQDQLGNNPLVNYFFKNMVKRACKVVVLNEISKEWILKKTGCNAIILPNFIDEKLVLSSKKKKVSKIQEVFFAGHLLETKGIKEMSVIAENNPDIHFTFAGVFTEDVKKILHKHNISLLGDVAHEVVINCLDESDLYLFLSHTEGFSISLLEAMSRGIPCLVSNVGANADMMKECCSVIVEAKNSQAAIEGFDEIKNYTISQLEEISNAEINKVKEYYTTNVVLKQILALYKEIQDESKD